MNLHYKCEGWTLDGVYGYILGGEMRQRNTFIGVTKTQSTEAKIDMQLRSNLQLRSLL